MLPFDYHRATSIEDAVAALTRPGSVPLSGGTDLMPQLRDGISAPAGVVDLRRIPGASDVTWGDDGGCTIGGAARLADIARDARIRATFPLLAESCAAVGSNALRHMGTLGGNLCQRPRCEYFRHGFSCHKNGGSSCPAATGENERHAIFGGGPCVAVHPSDPAVALTALDGVIHVAGPHGLRDVAVDDFFVLPARRLDLETVLDAGEFVSGVSLPAHAAGGVQRYEKVMARGAWDFALVSLAALRRRDGEVRLVLGGVAPVPWRVTDSIEEDVASGGLGDDDIETLAQRAMYDAVPLAKNGYKVEMAAALLRRAIRELVAGA